MTHIIDDITKSPPSARLPSSRCATLNTGVVSAVDRTV